MYSRTTLDSVKFQVYPDLKGNLCPKDDNPTVWGNYKFLLIWNSCYLLLTGVEWPLYLIFLLKVIFRYVCWTNYEQLDTIGKKLNSGIYFTSCDIMGLVMDVIQHIPCLVVRYVNVACRKWTIITFSAFQMYIS